MEFKPYLEKFGRDRFAAASAALLALLAMLMLATFRDYGYSWDEMGANYRHGLDVIRFYLSLGKDLGKLNHHDFANYGGAFDILADGLIFLTPLDPRNARHLANALAGFACLVGAWKLARELFDSETAFYALFILALCPAFYGHLYINPKDVPFAAGYVWALYLTFRLDRKTGFSSALALGAVIGFTMGVRVGGVILFFYALLHLALKYGRHRLDGGVSGFAPTDSLKRLALAGITAYALMFLTWPSALLSPIAHPIKTFFALNDSVRLELILWAGRIIRSTEVPWDYLPRLFAVELPEAFVLLAIPALSLATWLSFGGKNGLRGYSPAHAVLVVSTLFPPLWAVLCGSTLYDNARHFLFILAPLAICCGHFAAETRKWLNARRKGFGDAALVALFAGFLAAGVQMFRLHPYEYVYKNSFAGGMPKAAALYETDYWLTSYREAFALVREHAAKAARGVGRDFNSMEFAVAVVGEPGLAEEELPPNMKAYFLVRESDARADYLVATTRYGSAGLWPEFPEVGRVERLGMPFSVVKTSPFLADAAQKAP